MSDNNQMFEDQFERFVVALFKDFAKGERFDNSMYEFLKCQETVFDTGVDPYSLAPNILSRLSATTLGKNSINETYQDEHTAILQASLRVACERMSTDGFAAQRLVRHEKSLTEAIEQHMLKTEARAQAMGTSYLGPLQRRWRDK
jgi:hypothetical protein